MEAVWEPLEKRLGKTKCVGFMFMGCVNGVNRYKHGIARTNLYLDNQGNCYVPGRSGTFTPADWEIERSKLEACLIALGWSLTTPYNENFIAQKRNALLKRGIWLLTITVDQQETNIR